MADEELERARALITRVRGMRIVGCPGGCDPKDVAGHPMAVRFGGDQWHLEACSRCLAGGARRVLPQLARVPSSVQELRGGVVWVAGVWTMAHVAVRLGEGQFNSVCLPQAYARSCADPVLTLRLLPAIDARQHPHHLASRCGNCERANPARLHVGRTGAALLLEELRQQARQAVLGVGHDPGELGM